MGPSSTRGATVGEKSMKMSSTPWAAVTEKLMEPPSIRGAKVGEKSRKTSLRPRAAVTEKLMKMSSIPLAGEGEGEGEGEALKEPQCLIAY
jgi:hypothetical protein